MGEQYGEAARDEIQANCSMFQPDWQSEASRRKSALIKAGLQDWQPEILAEMEGMAAAARVDLSQILLMNHVVSEQYGDECTPLLLHDSPEGPVVAKNNDASPRESFHFILRQCRPSKGLPLMQLTYAGWLSGLDAINAAGLANTHGSVGSRFAALGQGPDIRLLMYHCMKKCSTLAELVSIIRQASCRGKGFSIAVADAAGHSAILDAAVPLLGVRAQNQDFAFSTNLYMTTGLEQADLRPAAKRVVAQYRQGFLQWTAQENPPRNQADIRALLCSHQPWAPCRHGGAHLSQTNWSMLALPLSRQLFVASGAPCRNSYVEYQLN